jgi:hypothetical protein
MISGIWQMLNKKELNNDLGMCLLRYVFSMHVKTSKEGGQLSQFFQDRWGFQNKGFPGLKLSKLCFVLKHWSLYF